MTSPKTADVSVIVPVCTGERYVTEALESILEQSVTPAEVLVIDDGSTDDTPHVLESFGASIRVITQPNRGIAGSRNVGIREATHSLLGFLDADDLMTPRSLELRLERLFASDEPDAVFGRIEQFVSPDVDPARASRFRFVEGPQAGLFSTLLGHRAAFDKVGPIDESFQAGAEIDWISRARLAGLRFVDIDEVALRRRIHADNHSTRFAAKNAELLRVVNAHRRRTLDREEEPNA
jgi:glycosyltransferase involved in cell wall biosynthesis